MKILKRQWKYITAPLLLATTLNIQGCSTINQPDTTPSQAANTLSTQAQPEQTTHQTAESHAHNILKSQDRLAPTPQSAYPVYTRIDSNTTQWLSDQQIIVSKTQGWLLDSPMEIRTTDNLVDSTKTITAYVDRRPYLSAKSITLDDGIIQFTMRSHTKELSQASLNELIANLTPEHAICSEQTMPNAKANTVFWTCLDLTLIP